VAVLVHHDMMGDGDEPTPERAFVLVANQGSDTLHSSSPGLRRRILDRSDALPLEVANQGWMMQPKNLSP
jgi:hypothetical protein